MDDKANILNLVAKKLYERKVQSLTQGKPSEPHNLSDGELKRLAAKISLLPDDWQEILLLHYGCGFDSALIDDMLEMKNSAGEILYAKDILEDAVEIENISDESMVSASRIAFKTWHDQVKAGRISLPVTWEKKRFKKRIHRLLRRQGNVVHLKFSRYVKRASIVMLALLVTATVMVFSVEALRTKFFDWWFSVFPTHMRIEFANVEQIYGAENYEKLKKYNPPTYIPNGFTLIEAVEMKNNYTLEFQDNSDGWIILTIKMIHEGAHDNLNIENAEMERITINGSEGFYVYNNGDSLITWSDKNVLFRLSCNLSKEEALKIATSTKIK